ncbi:hypothetical protein QFZ46_001307 [Microbacterium murale]|uniref:Uncharacterized protein n=1 Tax=Microbacterium murale TaxID=1081040 RepID=A0ABU0P8B9_9MICO|nr:hypothetical protein [Microbacterium murale]
MSEGTGVAPGRTERKEPEMSTVFVVPLADILPLEAARS